MFFKKLFAKKTFTDCEAKGDQYVSAGRFADAKIEFEDAIDLIGTSDSHESGVVIDRIRGKLSAVGNELAMLNINEARFAKSSGDLEKAVGYLDLAAQFSQDPQINRQIADLVNDIKCFEPKSSKTATAHGCATCTPHAHQDSENTGQGTHSLSAHERFELMVAPLPDNLPARYLELGEEFASAYLAAHDGDVRAAISVYSRLNDQSPCDIYLYEMAVLKAQDGAIGEAEHLLREAVRLNPVNSLCCLSLVQLYSELRRFGEARTLLNRMQADGIMGNQVLLLLGDNSMATGMQEEAEGFYRQALTDKALASVAVERLHPILEQTGRLQEHKFLSKMHCGKGCC